MEQENDDERLLWDDEELLEERKFPTFMKFDNSTRILRFEPQNESLLDEVFYFNFILKEEKSDFMTRTYLAKVLV